MAIGAWSGANGLPGVGGSATSWYARGKDSQGGSRKHDIMRLVWAPLLLGLAGLAPGCTLEPTADGLKINARLPYSSSTRTLVADDPWENLPLRVRVGHGNVQVVGKREAKGISVRANTYTWADNAEDAGAMREAQLARFSFRRSADRIEVLCEKMEEDVESALASATQCNVRVEIPAPEGAIHDIEAFAEDGFTYLNRLASGPSTRILATGIEIQALTLRGNVSLHAGWLDAEIEPTPGGTVVVESTTGDWYFIPTLQDVPKREERDGGARFGATLRIPEDFRAERVELFSSGASVETFAFPDIIPGQPRGPLDASAAKLVAVKANQGNATLLVFGEKVTTSRVDDLGSDTRDPWSTPVGQLP